MQSDTSRSAFLAVLVLATFSSAALAQSDNWQQRMITKAPPKAQSKYITSAEVQTSALPYRYKTTRMSTTPSYIAPGPSRPAYANSSSLLEHTGSLLPDR